jgi:hypothetical protein
MRITWMLAACWIFIPRHGSLRRPTTCYLRGPGT